ncbi:MAG: hypothetical protein IPK14_10705 [Blastocatellia bacterium]|nr:hypothetical protein [Blastocatellia bacterium]
MSSISKIQNLQKLTLLLDVMKSLASELDINTLLPLIMKKTTEVMDADRSTLFLIDEKTNELLVKSCSRCRYC